MNLSNALGIVEKFDAERIKNIIANVIHVVLVYAPVLSLNEFPQLEPNILLEVDTFIQSKVHMYVIPHSTCIIAIPESLRG